MVMLAGHLMGAGIVGWPLGFVASLVLRCDDCVRYHIERCLDEGVTPGEMTEVLTVGLVVGGSITIPHLRRAFEALDAFSA